MSDVAARAAGHLRTVLGRARHRLGLGAGSPGDERRWNVVTIEASADEVAPDGQPPQLLAELGDAIEVDLRPAPGGRGTELRIRLARHRGAIGPQATQDDLRTALRRTKQLLEVGEVLQSVPRPVGHRPSTPAGKLVDLAEQESDQKGVL